MVGKVIPPHQLDDAEREISSSVREREGEREREHL